MDYKTYKTPADAQQALDALIGWPDAKIEELFLPNDPNADADGNAYVLRCADQYYMGTDGFAG